MMLARANAHPRDARVVFDEASHTYTVDDTKYTISVSGFLHQFFPSFDAAAVVDNCFDAWSERKDSKYFALIRYLRHVLGLDDEAVKKEIALSWSAAGSVASTSGTKTHLDVELLLNDEAHDADNPDLAQFQAWRATHPSWEPYRTEWSIFCDRAFVAGQIDSLWRDRDRIFMVDWKRCKLIEETSGKYPEHGFPPFERLHNTNYGHYCVQQNAYAHMLRTHYGIECAGLYLVQLHPELPTFREWELPVMRREIELAFEKRASEVAAGKYPGFVPVGRKRQKTLEDYQAAEENREHAKKMMVALERRCSHYRDIVMLE